ncbi:MAG TPA: phage holin family protein [Myxococcaceae bacterium]|jgi:uncharacterized membrane protein YqjE|nr:phage holin family protein [Myxococcaceae bacterium]
MRAREKMDGAGLAAAVSRITDGMSRLFSEHLALARIEIQEDGRAFAFATARLAGFALLMLVGYGFLCAAAAVALWTWIGIGWALLVVALFNLLIGGVGVYTAIRRLKGREVLDETLVEVSRSAEVLAAASRSDGRERRLEA